MKTSNRRDFLKKAALAGASALVAPGLLATEEKEGLTRKTLCLPKDH